RGITTLLLLGRINRGFEDDDGIDTGRIVTYIDTVANHRIRASIDAIREVAIVDHRTARSISYTCRHLVANHYIVDLRAASVLELEFVLKFVTRHCSHILLP